MLDIILFAFFIKFLSLWLLNVSIRFSDYCLVFIVKQNEFWTFRISNNKMTSIVRKKFVFKFFKSHAAFCANSSFKHTNNGFLWVKIQN